MTLARFGIFARHVDDIDQPTNDMLRLTSSKTGCWEIRSETKSQRLVKTTEMTSDKRNRSFVFLRRNVETKEAGERGNTEH